MTFWTKSIQICREYQASKQCKQFQKELQGRKSRYKGNKQMNQSQNLYPNPKSLKEEIGLKITHRSRTKTTKFMRRNESNDKS